MTQKPLESHENGGKNETSRGDVGASSPALDIDTWIGGDDMPVDRHYTDSARADNPYYTNAERTPGTVAWKAAVIRMLRTGLGSEDIALRLGCDVQEVRNLIAHLREYRLLDGLYKDSRKGWQSIGSIASRLVDNAGGDA